MNKPIILLDIQHGNCRGVDSQGRESKVITRVYDNGAIIPTCLRFKSTENPICGLSESLLCKYHRKGA